MQGKIRRFILDKMQHFFKELVGQDELISQIEELKVGQNHMSSQIDSVIRGLAMTINQQNKILERLDDIEAAIIEIKKENNIDE